MKIGGQDDRMDAAPAAAGISGDDLAAVSAARESFEALCEQCEQDMSVTDGSVARMTNVTAALGKAADVLIGFAQRAANRPVPTEHRQALAGDLVSMVLAPPEQRPALAAGLVNGFLGRMGLRA